MSFGLTCNFNAIFSGLPRRRFATPRNDNNHLNLPVIANEVKQSRKELNRHSELDSESHEMLPKGTFCSKSQILAKKVNQVQHDTKNTAFTLAETLITLAIIGIIAALTIPNLLHKHKVTQTVAAVTKAQSMLSNALKMAEIEYGSVDTWDVGPYNTKEGAKKLGEILFSHLKVQKICGAAGSGCFGSSYKTLQGTAFRSTMQPGYTNAFYKVLLEDGSAIMVWSNGTATGSTIGVDINGPQQPNRYGIDFFMFGISSTYKNIVPVGLNSPHPCEHSGTSNTNGYGCSRWLLYKKNMDYTFRDISWDE